MTLYLVGENIDKSRVQYKVETGKLTQLMRGIYVDAGDNIEATVLKHAIRIAGYLYPNTYLAGASAFLLRPTDAGKLYISGRRKQRTRIRNLEIVQNEAPPCPSVAPAIVDDGMGEFKTEVSSIRQRFLEAFRRRSELATSVDSVMRDAMARRLIEEYGSPEKTTDAIWALARENKWYKEAEDAENYLGHGLEIKPPPNAAEFKLIVAWHGSPVGTLAHDGFEWRWSAAQGFNLPLVRQTVPGMLPPFINSLLPEGWLGSVLKNEDDRAALRTGKRYMSNIVIVERREDMEILPPDILQTRLAEFSAESVFTGRYKGPRRDDLETSFEENLAKIYERADTPRLSGVQIKAPMCLEADGSLAPSAGKPFTHILKPAGTSGFAFLPLIECLCLSLGRQAGFVVNDFALISMPDNMAPALVVERFDIRTSASDDRLMAMEDFCSLLDLSPADKYKGTIEQAGRALRPVSTDPESDLLQLFKRALFAWFIADGDMHLKNMAVLKIAMRGEKAFRSVRIAPLYDAVTTVVFPDLKNDRMALKLNGKDNRLKRVDFLRLAATLGVKASAADEIIDAMIAQLAAAAAKLPKGLTYGEDAAAISDRMLAECRRRVSTFA